MEEKPLEQSAEKEEVKEIIVQIKLYPTGRIDVTGPIANEMLCLFLFEKAKDIVKAYVAKLGESKIQKPCGILNFARRRF